MHPIPMDTALPPDADRIRELAHAYLHARYRLRIRGRSRSLPITVGLHAALVESMAPHACGFAVISAYNPASLPRTAHTNRDADRMLHAQLRTAGLPIWRGMSSDHAGHWREPNWLVCGIARPEALAMADRFGQLGLLYWQRGSPVGLHMRSPPYAGDEDSPALHWQAQESG